jgi:orotate phosphoribosyltransferase
MDENQEILNIFESIGAHVIGHFRLASGNDSDSYVHVRLALGYPEHALTISKKLADAFQKDKVNVVVGFTIGGHILAKYVAEHLNARVIPATKAENRIIFAKCHKIENGEGILVVDDVLTTGNSIYQALNTIKNETPGILKGVGVVVDRSKKEPNFGVKTVTLRRLSMNLWAPESCPLCKKGDKPIDLRLADKELLIAFGGLPEQDRLRVMETYSQTYEYLFYGPQRP